MLLPYQIKLRYERESDNYPQQHEQLPLPFFPGTPALVSSSISSCSVIFPSLNPLTSASGKSFRYTAGAGASGPASFLVRITTSISNAFAALPAAAVLSLHLPPGGSLLMSFRMTDIFLSSLI
ncbi:MAG: hypothetical protein HZC49_02945 [Nitrospirae bacterium]|nr:hypothetical protein [Nitrospirota bacterium]